jgi:hypothetical protein
LSLQTKRTASVIIDEDPEDADMRRLLSNNFIICLVLIIIIAKKKHGSLGNPLAVDEEGLLLDVEVQMVDKDPPTREDKRRDVDQFFHPPVDKEIDGKIKKMCLCKVCP